MPTRTAVPPACDDLVHVVGERRKDLVETSKVKKKRRGYLAKDRSWARCPPVLGTVPLVEHVFRQTALAGFGLEVRSPLLGVVLPSWESLLLTVQRLPTSGNA